MWENRFEVRDRTQQLLVGHGAECMVGQEARGGPRARGLEKRSTPLRIYETSPAYFFPNGCRPPAATRWACPTRGWPLCPLAPAAVFSRRHPRGLPLQGLHPKANAGKVLVIQDPNRPPIRPDFFHPNARVIGDLNHFVG